MTEDPLAVTLATYEATADRYRDANGPYVPSWLAFVDRFVARVAGGRVLEIGSGPGRDALLLEQRGLSVTRSDATAAFVAMMAADGHRALRIDVRVDPLGGPYDAAFANASLLHLDRADLAPVLRRLRSVVADAGTLAVTLKEGDGEEWHSRKLHSPRRFTYWREPELRDVLRLAGWSEVSIDHAPGRDEPWIYVLATAR